MLYAMSSATCKNSRGRFIHYAAMLSDDGEDDEHTGLPILASGVLSHRYETIAELVAREPEWDTPVHSVLTIADCHVIRDAIIKAGISPVPGVMTIRYRVNNGCDPLTGEYGHV